MKVTESGLLCVKREVDGVDVNIVGIWIVEDHAGARRGAYGVLEREIYRFFRRKIAIFQKSIWRVYFEVFLM